MGNYACIYLVITVNNNENRIILKIWNLCISFIAT